jgi:predicted nucleic acid-binding protein
VTTLVYVDSSALLKLVFRENETDALSEFLQAHTNRCASIVARVEVMRAARFRERGASVTRADEVLAHVNLIRLAESVVVAAESLEPLTLRALDAIHLATALSLGSDLAGMVVYDHRLADAARHAGLTVWAPS